MADQDHAEARPVARMVDMVLRFLLDSIFVFLLNHETHEIRENFFWVARGGKEWEIALKRKSLVPRLHEARPHPGPLPEERENRRQMA